MKKCPKCGTVLDDSKKQCYMCGTNLEANKIDLSEKKSIGAIVSGDGKKDFEKKAKFSGADSEEKKPSFFNQDSKDDLNSLNAAPTDKRSKLQKGLDSLFGNKKFKDKTDISKTTKDKKKKDKKGTEENVPKGPQAKKNAMELVEKPKKEEKPTDFGLSKKNPFEQNNVITQEDNNFGKPFKEEKNIIDQTVEPEEKELIKEEPIKEEAKQEKVTSFGFLNEIPEEDTKTKKHDFGFTKKREEDNDKAYEFHAYKPSFMDKLKGMIPKGPTRGYKDGREDFRFTGQMFVNIIAIIFFICVVYYVWNFVINKKTDTTLSGLVYDINSDFKLKSKDKLSRYYEYNSDCTIKITTGSDTSVDNYLENIQGTYGNDNDAIIQREQLKIHSNIWESLAVIYYPKEGTIGGNQPLPRYRYTSINHKGDFFAIIFVNTYEDKTCQSMYDEFSKTLNFKEG